MKTCLLLLGLASLAALTASCGSYPSANPSPRLDIVLDGDSGPSASHPLK